MDSGPAPSGASRNDNYHFGNVSIEPETRTEDAVGFLRPTRNLPHQSDRFLDHACGDIEMGAGADTAIHRGEQYAALAQGFDHFVAADAGAIGIEEHEIGLGLLHLYPLDLRKPPRQRAGIGVIVGEPVDVVAFDLTPQMLKKAAQRCAEAGIGNVTFREGNAAELPFADANFDAVVTRLSVHHFDRPARAISEIFRVLRPGGRFVVADVISSEVAAESELQNAIEILRDPSHVRMLPSSELTSLVKDAGFEIEQLTAWDKPREFGDGWASSTTPRGSRRFVRWSGR